MVTARIARRKAPWRSAAARRLFEMAGNPATIGDAVEIVAGKFLEGAGGPPFDLEEIQKRLKVNSVETENIPFSGELRRGDDGYTIVLSRHLSPGRRQFTIAHELAHAILETTGPRCPRSGSELERICNMLATELLMPRSLFLRLLGGGTSIRKIIELSRTFGTSVSATAIRLGELRQCSTFGVDQETVYFGYGIVNKGPLSRLREDLEPMVREALSFPFGTRVIFLWHTRWGGNWKLEWATLRGHGRTLFLLQPLQRRQNHDAVLQ